MKSCLKVAEIATCQSDAKESRKMTRDPRKEPGYSPTVNRFFSQHVGILPRRYHQNPFSPLLNMPLSGHVVGRRIQIMTNFEGFRPPPARSIMPYTYVDMTLTEACWTSSVGDKAIISRTTSGRRSEERALLIDQGGNGALSDSA